MVNLLKNEVWAFMHAVEDGERTLASIKWHISSSIPWPAFRIPHDFLCKFSRCLALEDHPGSGRTITNKLKEELK